MRISDWSSDVCSSDLGEDHRLDLDPDLARDAVGFRMEGRREDGVVEHALAAQRGSRNDAGADGADDAADAVHAEHIQAVVLADLALHDRHDAVADWRNDEAEHRKSRVQGKRVYVSVDLGGGRTI